jgi:putative addiction module component (TIGR02574 family)
MAPAAAGCKRLLGCRLGVYNGAMTSRALELLREALALPVEERAAVAAELLASIDDGSEDPAEVEAAWAAEIERRARRVLAGGRTGVSWQDVRNRAESDLRKR